MQDFHWLLLLKLRWDSAYQASRRLHLPDGRTTWRRIVRVRARARSNPPREEKSLCRSRKQLRMNYNIVWIEKEI
jgi:hypothetical protein